MDQIITYYFDAIRRGRVKKAEKIRIRFKLTNDDCCKSNRSVLSYAFKADIKTIDYVLSLGFKIYVKDLPYLLMRKPTKEAIKILKHVLSLYSQDKHENPLNILYYDVGKSYLHEINNSKNDGLLYLCKTYEQISLLLEFKIATLSLDVMNHFLKQRVLFMYKLCTIFNCYEQDQMGNTLLHNLNCNIKNWDKILLLYPDLSIKNKDGLSIFRSIWPTPASFYNAYFRNSIIDNSIYKNGPLKFDINDLDYKGRTILFHYNFRHKDEIFKIIDLGGDVYIKDKMGKTIFDLNGYTTDLKEDIKKYIEVPEIKGAI